MRQYLCLAILATLAGCSSSGGVSRGLTDGGPASAHGAPAASIGSTISDATILASAPEATYADSDRRAAYDYLNAIRVQCGFGERIQSVALDKAAQAHAEFIAANLDAGRSDAYRAPKAAPQDDQLFQHTSKPPAMFAPNAAQSPLEEAKRLAPAYILI